MPVISETYKYSLEDIHGLFDALVIRMVAAIYTVNRWMEPYTDYIVPFVVTFGVLLLIIFLIHNCPKSKGKRTMAKYERRSKLADLLCDAIEDAVYKGLLTRRESNRMYKQLAWDFQMDGMLKHPWLSRKHPKQLKHEIFDRVYNSETLKTPAPLPDIPKKVRVKLAVCNRKQ